MTDARTPARGAAPARRAPVRGSSSGRRCSAYRVDGLAPADRAGPSGRGRARARRPGVVPPVADEAALVEPELRARPRAAAGRSAGPAAGAARVPRLRRLPRRAHARAVHAARTRSSSSSSRSTPTRSSGSRTTTPAAASSSRSATSATTTPIGAAIAHLGPAAQRRRRRLVVPGAVRVPAQRQREQWGATLIPWRNLRAIFGVLRRREMLGLLVDWGYRSDGIPVRLFDAWTTLPAGPATLAAKTGSRILPVITTRQPDGRLHVGLGASRSTSPPRTRPSSSARPRRSPTRSPTTIRPAPDAVVQLQADLAGDAPRKRPTWSAARRAMQAGRPDPGPARACARPGRSAPSIDGASARAERDRGRTAAVARRSAAGCCSRRRGWPAGCPEGPLVPARRAGRRPVVPRSRPARAAQARRNLRRVCQALADVGSRQRRASARPPPTRDALERLVRSAFRHAARYYLEVARDAGRHPRLRRRAARARHPGAHRRGGRPRQGRPVRRAPLRVGRARRPLPRLPGRRDGDADGDDRRPGAAGLLRADPRRRRHPARRPARGAARAHGRAPRRHPGRPRRRPRPDRRRDADPALRGARPTCRWGRRCSPSRAACRPTR